MTLGKWLAFSAAFGLSAAATAQPLYPGVVTVDGQERLTFTATEAAHLLEDHQRRHPLEDLTVLQRKEIALLKLDVETSSKTAALERDVAAAALASAEAWRRAAESKPASIDLAPWAFVGGVVSGAGVFVIVASVLRAFL